MRIQLKDFDYARPGFYMAMEKCGYSFMISSCVVGEGGEVSMPRARHDAGIDYGEDAAFAHARKRRTAHARKSRIAHARKRRGACCMCKSAGCRTWQGAEMRTCESAGQRTKPQERAIADE